MGLCQPHGRCAQAHRDGEVATFRHNSLAVEDQLQRVFRLERFWLGCMNTSDAIDKTRSNRSSPAFQDLLKCWTAYAWNHQGLKPTRQRQRSKVGRPLSADPASFALATKFTSARPDVAVQGGVGQRGGDPEGQVHRRRGMTQLTWWSGDGSWLNVCVCSHRS